MQSVSKIKNDINQLSYSSKLELLRYTRNLIEQESKSEVSLSDAALLMAPFYHNDKELTAFSSIESDFYEEG